MNTATQPQPIPTISIEEISEAVGAQSANDAGVREDHKGPYTFTGPELEEYVAMIRAAARHEAINTPETKDFIAGVALEATHQRERWGNAHDQGKTPFDWVFLIGHLATRAAMHLKDGNLDKALHHAVTAAAACANWHAAMQGQCDMRPGIAHPDGP